MVINLVEQTVEGRDKQTNKQRPLLRYFAIICQDTLRESTKIG